MSLRLWDEQVLPRLTDMSMRGQDLAELRKQACVGLAGRVVELGFGSGLNLPHYPAAVTSVSAVEPSDVAWRLSAPRREASPLPVERVGLDAQRLPVPDGSHDHALVTFSLCTIPDPMLALDEVRRVLRPGGTLHLVEHGLAETEGVRRWQRRLEPVQRRLAGGCHLTRDVPDLLVANGWRVEEMESFSLPAPAVGRPWTYIYRGRATPDRAGLSGDRARS